MTAAVSPDGHPVIEVRDLHKDYGGVHAVRGLSMAVATNEIHCIIGPNGAGKSTLFKLLMGIEKPTSGRILHRGHDITALPPFRRARLGLAIKFQNRAMHLTQVRQLVDFWRAAGLAEFAWQGEG